MKKLLFLLSIMLCYSCNTPCTFAQFQNQIVHAGPNCTAVLPDFWPLASVIGGCTGFTHIQLPAPGTIIKSNTSVILRVTSTNGRSSQISFMALFTDTITPKITFPLAQVDSLLKKSNGLYDIADSMVGQIDEIQNNIFPFDSFPGMEREDSYKNKLLVIASRDSAGHRQRVMTYMDSLEIPIYTVVDTSYVAELIRQNDLLRNMVAIYQQKDIIYMGN